MSCLCVIRRKTNADKPQPQHTLSLSKRGCIDGPEHIFLYNFVSSAVGCRYVHTCEWSFPSSSQCSPSHGSTLACSLEISPPPSLLPLHHAPRWSPVPLHSVLPLPLAQPSRSIWPMTRVRATTSLQVIWPPVKSRVRLGGSGSLTDPFSVSFFFRIPPCQQLSHLSQVFIERGAYPFFFHFSSLSSIRLQFKLLSLVFLLSGTHYLCLCCRIPQLWSAGFQNAALLLWTTPTSRWNFSSTSGHPIDRKPAGEAGSQKQQAWNRFPSLNKTSCPVVEEWYVPVRPLFPSEAEGGSQKTNTGGGGGGGGGALGAPRFIVRKEARNVGPSFHVFFVPPGRSTVCLQSSDRCAAPGEPVLWLQAIPECNQSVCSRSSPHMTGESTIILKRTRCTGDKICQPSNSIKKPQQNITISSKVKLWCPTGVHGWAVGVIALSLVWECAMANCSKTAVKVFNKLKMYM